MKNKTFRSLGILGIFLGMVLSLSLLTWVPSKAYAAGPDTIMFEQEETSQRDPVTGGIMYIVIPLGLSFLICSAFKAQMKSVHKAREASHYVTDNSIRITYHTDNYTHSTHVRTPIPRKENRP